MILVVRTIIKIISFSLIATNTMMDEIIPSDWKTIERIAEAHPYVVALLNGIKIYSCTGTIINERTVLTSGTCVKNEIIFVAVTVAAFDVDTDPKTLFKVAFTRLHHEYKLELALESNENITRMQSNIGLVFTVKPYLELFVNGANIGNYLISDLRNAELSLVGYGKLDDRMMILQIQVYHQTPCLNAEWYNCLCGIESSDIPKTHIGHFGEGAPLLLGPLVVGIATFPSGSLALEDNNIVYNIFTIISPYLDWIINPDTEAPMGIVSQETQTSSQKRFEVECLCLCVIVSKIVT